MISFRISKKELVTTLKQLKNPISVRRNDVYFLKCQLIVLSNQIVFKLPGNELNVSVETFGTGITSFFFHDFEQALIFSKSREIEIVINAKTIQLNKSVLSATSEFLSIHKTKQKLELPMEFLNEVEHSKKTRRSLSNAKAKVSKSEIDTEIEFIYAKLYKYGIEKLDIQQFIYNKLGI